MSDILSAIQLRWDAPYRVLASLLSIGCACVLAGWAAGPLDALGHVGAYLTIPQAQEVTGNVSSWLVTRSAVVSPVAWSLFFLGMLANVGDATRIEGPTPVPGPWRGAPTALIALAALWEVNPEQVLIAVILLLVGGAIALGVMHYRNGWDTVATWLAFTTFNLIGSVLFVLAPVVWMISRPSPKEGAGHGA